MATLIEKLADYGMNVSVTMERFVGNEKLYEICFNMLLDDQNFTALENAVKEKDYNAAFEASHALKGVIANLGLAPLLDKMDVLVEALRAGDYSDVDSKYEEVARAFEVVKNLL